MVDKYPIQFNAMPILTELEKKLLEVHEIQLQIAKKKAVLMDTQAALEQQMREIFHKQSDLDKLMHQARQKELYLQQQIQLNKQRTQSEPRLYTVSSVPSKKLHTELLTLLQGNAAVANRLLKQQQLLNPGQTIDWYLEKVIYDLKRDRS
ncbi:hypothetical protein LC593_13305 [Nostoc sp. CHAB 5844]|nr:hypothetical protein [Nostoc sp. CHAB 5844]